MRASHPLLHPLMLASIALLVVNDHVLKEAFPGWLTGKLSDVAGLAFFPLVLATAWELGGPRAPRQRVVMAAALATALVFAAIKLWPMAGDVYRVGLAALQWPFHALLALADGRELPAVGRVSLTPDPSDLLALPAVLVPLWLTRRQPAGDVADGSPVQGRMPRGETGCRAS